MSGNSGLVTRREFLVGAGAFALETIAAREVPGFASESRKKPNLVFIFADQLRSQALGCYGDKQARTPNIDKLAAQGARFTNAISTWPVCSPFRGMLLTGRYPMSNGVVENNYPLLPGQNTIASVLKAHGYETGYIGKWHLNGGMKDVPKNRRQGFDYWMPPQGGILTSVRGGTEQTWRPDVQTGYAVDYIKAHKGKPFCLFMSWNPPHDPYIAPDKFMQMFPISKMRLRPNTAESAIVRRELKRHPVPPDSDIGKKRSAWRKRLDSDDGIRAIMSGYYAATAGLDVCIGRIMNTLEQAGIAEDTILVFSSDHGDMLGSHRMCLKQEPFEESISIPFIVRYPRVVQRGTVTDALLSPVDIMPTLLGLAGAACPDSVEGINLAQAATGKRSDQQDALLIMKMMPGGNPWAINAATEWRGVRTKSHTYARLANGGPWLLFDNKSDPYQMKNLVDDPAHKKLRDKMETTMQSLLKKAHDPFDAEIIRRRIMNRSKVPAQHSSEEG